jgi:hypothetical protein
MSMGDDTDLLPRAKDDLGHTRRFNEIVTRAKAQSQQYARGLSGGSEDETVCDRKSAMARKPKKVHRARKS